MILVVGGAHSGKRTFVREKLGFAADDFVDAAQLAEGGVPAAFAGRVAYRVEELVRALDADRALERLIGFDAVILSLVGSGVVPMRAEDAQWRERAGRLGCALAARADVVVRMTCGIPQVIKGNLADAPRGTLGAGAPLEVIFVRHGATAGTEDHRYSGAGTDEPLSSAGERALRDLACDRDVFRVITSGMARTDQTARILFPNAELMACPGLREMDFGDFEGRSAAELKEDARYCAWVDSWCETRCPHGEGKSDFTRRVVAAFREAFESECAQGSGRAVFVVHAGTVKALLSELAVPKMCIPSQAAHGPPPGMGAAFATFAPLRGAMPGDDDSCRRRRVRGRPCLRRPALASPSRRRYGARDHVGRRPPAGRIPANVRGHARRRACARRGASAYVWTIYLGNPASLRHGSPRLALCGRGMGELSDSRGMRAAPPEPGRGPRVLEGRPCRGSWDATRLFSTSRASRAPSWKRWRRTRATASSHRFSTL